MLELRNVTKRFSGIAAVDNVSFQARPGEVTGYLGPNGSGKSTTMKMITGLIEMTSGEILFNGERIQRDPIAYKQRMGYVPEEPYLYPHLTGLEYLVMVGQLRGLPAKPTAERIEGLLRLFSLHGDRHVPISSYSKGMRQKILLSAALLHNPDLILLDEPFSGLDLVTKSHLLGEIALLSETRNLTVLLVTHDPTEATTLCQSALVLDQGHLVESGPWKELLAAPQSEVLKVFREQVQALESVSEKA